MRFGFVTERVPTWLVVAVYAMSGLAFVSDLYRDNTLAYGILYAPLVATSVCHRGRTGLWLLSLVACLMVVMGALFPVVDPDLPDLIANRVLSIMAIAATAAFVHHARGIQDQLAAATRRAEAAERIKTDVLDSLSEGIRTPLHSLLGVLSLPMSGSQPHQREALGRVRDDVRHLLETIDNVLDLAQIEGAGPGK